MIERLDSAFRTHLQLQDPQFFRLVQKHPVLTSSPTRPPFEALVRIVTGQQLSVAAAETVFQRVRTKLDGNVCAQSILNADLDDLRSVGLSRSKARSLHGLAEFSGTNEARLLAILSKSWESTRSALLEIHGIGPWSVDMFGMFGLGLPDIFSAGDLGLRVAMERHLGIPEKQKPEVYDRRALLWSPYRTLASLHLWHSLKPDNERFAQ